jgi:putative ABC transport system permease protein
MFTLLRTLSLGYLWQRWTRTTLLIASIALGVATLVATRALHDALKKAARSAVNPPLTGLADIIVDNGQTGLPPSVLKTLREPRIPGVDEVLPLIIAHAALPELDNAQTWVFGLDDSEDQARTLHDSTGRFQAEIEWTVAPENTAAFLFQIGLMKLNGQTPGLVTAPLAARLEGKTSLRLRAAGRETTIGVLGRVRLKGDLSVLGDNAVFTLLSAAGLMATPDRPETLSQINIRLEYGADPRQVMAALRERLGGVGAVQTTEENFAQYQELAGALELGFLLGSTGALVVGVFLIYNVLSVGVAERRHDIGILRSVGATRGQIASLFMAEAFVLGLIGSAIGLPLGYGIARFALGPLTQLISDMVVVTGADRLQFTFSTLAVALAAGVGTTVIAALVPAMQAAREEPADAVRRVPLRIGPVLRVLHILAVVTLLGVGLAFTIYRAELPTRFGVFAGIVCLLVGALVATPMLAEGVALVLQPLTRRFLGLEGRLAADNLIRTPGRTGLVIAALAATTALMIQTAGFIHSTEHAILDWIDTSIAADQFITSGDTVARIGVATLPMSTSLAKEIEKMDGVAAVVPVRFHRVEFRNRFVLLLAVDLEALRGKGLKHNPARDVEANPDLLLPGKASVSENFATLFGIKPGDKVTVPGPSGPVSLEVHSTYVDYSWNRGTILVNQEWFQKTFGDRLADVFDLYIKPGANPVRVRDAILARYGKSDAVYVMPRETFKYELVTMIDRIYIFAYAQQGVVGLVALLGVVSALLISVLQRRRELGLLRAVGASRAQVLRSVLSEAGLMGIIGAGIGVLVGMALEWYVLRILVLDDAGVLFPLLVPWVQVGFVALIAIVMPLLVGIWPAHQATQLRIADAIAYE